VTQPDAPGTLAPARTEPEEWADLQSVLGWLRTNKVLAWGILLIIVSVAWKAQFLSHLYFRQDDFHDLDLAIQSPFGWRYLTFIGAGHLIIGLRAVAWLLVRVSLYNWTLASAITLALVAAASLAALRLLRMLFGDRPAILIPLLVYVLCPLTLPDLGEWSSALESVPLQLALFMAAAAHVNYVRTGQGKHLAAAAGWVTFGLIFFEKGLVVPVLLFALTAWFVLEQRGNWLSGIWTAARRFWRAWVAYGLIAAAYLVLLARSLHTSTTHPAAPASAAAVSTFARGLLKDSLVPGALGGPWQWNPVAGSSYSFAAPPFSLMWISALAAAAVIWVSIWRRRIAWRAWVVLIVWVVLADMLPVIISRLGSFSPGILATETRYVADAVPVLALCLALAFWPLERDRPRAPSGSWIADAREGHLSFEVTAALIGVFVFGSIWSIQAYENVTTGRPAAQYIADATAAIRLAPRGTPVMNVAVPGDMVEGLFGRFALQSTVIGDIRPGTLRWTRSPSGTLDGLRMFGPDGRLYPARVNGAKSLPLAPGQRCWPARNGQIVVRFTRPSPSYGGMLRIGYLWYSSSPGLIEVLAGGATRAINVKRGLHSAYVPVSGSVRRIVVNEFSGPGLCIGDAQAGNLGPNPAGASILPPRAR
jgi:hypothetical protein